MTYEVSEERFHELLKHETRYELLKHCIDEMEIGEEPDLFYLKLLVKENLDETGRTGDPA